MPNMPSAFEQSTRVSEYRIKEEFTPANRRSITIESRIQRDGETKWAVADSGATLRPGVGFMVESMPSCRSEETLEKNRFDTPEEAFQAYMEWYNSERN